MSSVAMTNGGRSGNGRTDVVPAQLVLTTGYGAPQRERLLSRVLVNTRVGVLIPTRHRTHLASFGLMETALIPLSSSSA